MSIENTDFRKDSFLRACKLAACLSKKLAAIVGPVDAAGALIAAALDELQGEIGTHATGNYFRDLARELDDDGMGLQ